MVSPFTFYRGAAPSWPPTWPRRRITDIRVQICGDCHLMNFGGFATPERRMIFDINDFDETLPGPWEWDVKRLAASFVLAAAIERLRRGETSATRRSPASARIASAWRSSPRWGRSRCGTRASM